MRFFHNHGFLGLDTQHQWLTLEGGSRTYVEALLKAHPADFRFGQGVTGVRRDGAQVVVTTAAGEERFDRVIMASHADTSLRLLTDAVQDFDLSQSVEGSELTMPNFVMPDMAMPTDEPTAVEV